MTYRERQRQLERAVQALTQALPAAG